MIVALNKVDTLLPAGRAKAIDRMSKRIHSALSSTHFRNAPIVCISANPTGGEVEGIDLLRATLLDTIKLTPKLAHLRDEQVSAQTQPFRFSIDHCFSIKGQGTIMTGTVLSGRVRVNDTIELPELKVEKKIKSIQMFRKPVTQAQEGDRIGICVTQLNAELLERGVAGHPGAYIQTKGAIISAQRIQFFKGTIKSKSKMHISIGHTTVMGTIQVFRIPPQLVASGSTDFSLSREYLYADELVQESEEVPPGTQFILLTFEKRITCAADSMVIGSKLDSDIHWSLPNRQCHQDRHDWS